MSLVRADALTVVREREALFRAGDHHLFEFGPRQRTPMLGTRVEKYCPVPLSHPGPDVVHPRIRSLVPVRLTGRSA